MRVACPPIKWLLLGIILGLVVGYFAEAPVQAVAGMAVICVVAWLGGVVRHRWVLLGLQYKLLELDKERQLLVARLRKDLDDPSCDNVPDKILINLAIMGHHRKCRSNGVEPSSDDMEQLRRCMKEVDEWKAK
jgi:hypothetical protein